ncbi:YbgA family protein [Zobellella maritima]|uniref:YbgA family protein n=1 Tax=Zobellella maritima TaxID=2059725 RepID=UPI000E303CB1|nr:DUF523 and DUF1722 domain-containing protein [Zobellella maritima]
MYKFDAGKIQVGISGCLLGQKVRFDGGHKRSDFCTEELARLVDFVPVCPEMAIGLSSPRPSIRLVQRDADVLAITANGQDVTAPLRDYGRQLVGRLGYLSGYILCAKSPSCGMERVRVYHASGEGCEKSGVGVYAAELMRSHPLLPVEEDGRLNDPLIRENFITRLYAYHDWQSLVHQGITPARLIDFHSRYKYLLLAHHRSSYLRLGQLLSDLSAEPEHKARHYIEGLMAALARQASRSNHTNVLQHLQGYFKQQLNSRQRQELAHTIHQYQDGLLPLLAPITLLRHYLAEYPNEYLQRQVYLNPHPETLRLRYGI